MDKNFGLTRRNEILAEWDVEAKAREERERIEELEREAQLTVRSAKQKAEQDDIIKAKCDARGISVEEFRSEIRSQHEAEIAAWVAEQAQNGVSYDELLQEAEASLLTIGELMELRKEHQDGLVARAALLGVSVEDMLNEENEAAAEASADLYIDAWEEEQAQSGIALVAEEYESQWYAAMTRTEQQSDEIYERKIQLAEERRLVERWSLDDVAKSSSVLALRLLLNRAHQYRLSRSGLRFGFSQIFSRESFGPDLMTVLATWPTVYGASEDTTIEDQDMDYFDLFRDDA